MKEECYMCFQPGTTEEHAPPKCFFPEPKDLPAGMDLRKNLIKVPSCDLHNTSKSKDDEYLFALIAAHHGNNATAYNHYATKILRALTKNQGLAGKIAQNHRRIDLEGQPSFALQVDRSRFDNGMSHIARALHFKHTGGKWLEPVQILTSALREDNLEPNVAAHRIVAAWAAQLSGVPQSGENPEVFFYRLGPGIGGTTKILQMVFYGGFEVIALSGPGIEGVEP